MESLLRYALWAPVISNLCQLTRLHRCLTQWKEDGQFRRSTKSFKEQVVGVIYHLYPPQAENECK
jgi:hypothetical protein